MRKLIVSLALFLLIGLPTAAHASSITITPGTYSINDAYFNGFLITGDVTLNSSGVVTPVGDSLTWNGHTFTTGSGGLYGGTPVFSQDYIGGSYGQVALDFSLSYTSGLELAICTSTSDAACQGSHYSTLAGYNGNPSYNLTSGPSNTGTQAYLAYVPTPEPSSLALLGTGILGIAGAARRRFIKR